MNIKEIVDAISKLHTQLQDLQAQINDLQNQNFEDKSRFKRMSIAVDFRIQETRSSFFDG